MSRLWRKNETAHLLGGQGAQYTLRPDRFHEDVVLEPHLLARGGTERAEDGVAAVGEVLPAPVALNRDLVTEALASLDLPRLTIDFRSMRTLRFLLIA